MDGMPRSGRLLAVTLLLLSGVPARVGAQQFVCSPISRGDTASTLARRLMGNAAAAYSDAFQIRDPARRMFVPKSQYQRLRAHWQACVSKRPATSVPVEHEAAAAPEISAPAPEVAAVTSAPVAASTVSPPLRAAEGWWPRGVLGSAIGAAVLVMLAMTAAVAGSLARRPIPAQMQRAGEAFVTAFARPLVDPSSTVPPIRTRLRFVRRRQQLEVSIAPGPGRRYPNLADHKKNLEYDVNRVMRVLGKQIALGDQIRASGKWVVVPIRLADPKHTGAK